MKVVAEYGLEVPAQKSADEPERQERGRFHTIFTGRLLAATILFCLAGIAGQTLVYGLNTWLPQLMVLANYSLKSSLSFLLTVNIGAVVGVLVSSYLADRFGPRPVTAISFVCSGVALAVMGLGTLPMPVMYLLVAIVGFGSVGAQILVNGFLGTYYPNRVRATALGFMLGVGRIGAVIAIYGGGVLVAAALGTFVNFSVWAIAAALGLVAILLIPRKKDSVSESSNVLKSSGVAEDS